jgi:hypothetical protein
VRRVVTEIASTEKSDADTESCPINPLITHGVPALSCPVLINMIPDTELLRVLVNSVTKLVLSHLYHGRWSAYQRSSNSKQARGGNFEDVDDIWQKIPGHKSLLHTITNSPPR